MFQYIKQHVKGELSMFRSFFINTLAVNVFLGLLGKLAPADVKVMVFWIPFILILTCWQMIGCWASASHVIDTYSEDDPNHVAIVAYSLKIICLLMAINFVGMLFEYPKVIDAYFK